MLLERFHNRLHGSKHAKHAKHADSSPKLDATPNRDTEQSLEDQDSMSVDGDSEMQGAGPNPEANELRINTQMCSFRNFISQNGVSTPVSTPSTQPIMPYMYMNQKRQDSVASFASTISDMSYSQPGPNKNNASSVSSFSTQFVRLLMDVYQDICSDPTATPFDTTNPPPGILNRAAKVAIARAEEKSVDYGRERSALLIASVRKRLQQEVRLDGYLSRNSSMVSLPAMPLFNSSDMGPPMNQDYFGIHSDITPQQPLSTPFQISNYSSGQPQQQQQQQPLQTPFEHRTSIPKTLQRSRNDSFISAAGRSRSGSNQVFPFPQLQAPSSLEPGLARSRSGSNGYFALTPTNSYLGDIQRPTISRQKSNDSSAFDM
ncbi:LANO_0B02212g1_1 [Lachancea nothofagi CBS 11611]|uniref:LANO_0B02212g1_1 n=1 Tax=Lachancea nothofagi CBS 11611 TaxID=1266666 RepID=A0A1G4IWI2_9SACH|nr:LANO_0B02212g1_1 [Lachancea nothofagi CBS 11611]